MIILVEKKLVCAAVKEDLDNTTATVNIRNETKTEKKIMEFLRVYCFMSMYS